MEITVNEQAQRFYLALDKKWFDAVGHEIKVGEYRFCAIPFAGVINVSEVTTGAKLFNIPVDFTVSLITETKEGTIDFLYQVGEKIKRIIEKDDNFDSMLEKFKRISFERLGEKPLIEDVDTNWLFEEESEVIN